jgi:hypothetical protein
VPAYTRAFADWKSFPDTSTPITQAALDTIEQGIESAHTEHIEKTIVDAKGDLIAATAADAVSRFAVGSNYRLLKADSAQASGLRWADSEVINVKDYGATGDAATNDSTAIQAAMDAANTAGGGIVFFPVGTYIINATVTIYSKVHIRGAGIEATILKLKNTTNVDILKGQNFATLTGTNGTGGIYNWSVSDLTIDGNKANNATAGYGLRVYGYGFILSNLRIRDCRNDGIYSEWSTSADSPGLDGMDAQVVNVKTHDCAGHGLTWAGPHDSQFLNCLSYSNTSRGFNITSSGNASLFVNSHAWGNSQTYGWYLAGNAALMNCHAEGASSAQIYIASNNCQVYSGLIYAAGASTPVGIEIASAAAGSQIDTTILNCTSGGLKFTSDGGIATIRANVYQTSGAGISGTPSATSQLDVYVNGGGTGGSSVTLNKLDASSAGIRTRVNAGAPTGGDSGDLVVDTTNSRIYCKVAGTWKYAALT